MELHDGPIALTAWRPDDAPAVYAACQDPEIQRWIPGLPRPYTLDHARTFIGNADGFAVRERGQLVGAIALRMTADDTAATGYWCVREARGRGLATRALRRLCRHALDDLGAQRVELTAARGNVASQRVAEKVGFHAKE